MLRSCLDDSPEPDCSHDYWRARRAPRLIQMIRKYHFPILGVFIAGLFSGCSSTPPTADSQFGDLLDRIRAVATSGKLSDTAYVAGRLGCSVEVLDDPLRPAGAEVHDYVLDDCPSPVSKGTSALYGTRGPDGRTRGGDITFHAFDMSKLPSQAEVISLVARRFGRPECKAEKQEGTLFTYCAFIPAKPIPAKIGLLYQGSGLLIDLSIAGYDR